MSSWLMTGLRGVLWTGAVCLALLLVWIVLAFVWGVVGPWVRIAWLVGVKVFGRFFDALWNLTQTSRRLADRFEKWAKLCVAVGASSVLLLPRPSSAAEFSHETLTGSGVVLTDTGNRTPNFTAREELRLRSDRLQLAVRLDGNAEKAGVDLAEPGTVTTIELFGLASYRVAGPVALVGVYGWTRPSIGVPGPARETWLAGALVGSRERWVLVGAGVRRVVGDDLAAMAAWRVKVDGKASAVGDVVGTVRDGRLVYQARAGVALSVAGTP